MICYALIACVFATAAELSPEPVIVATGTIPMPVVSAEVESTPRPEVALAFASAVTPKTSPFDAILKGRLNLIRVDGNEIIDRFSPGLIRILKDIQAHFGRPIEVQSGYRSPTHNKRVGGARRSLHMQGRAADIRVPGVSGKRLLAFLRSHPRVGGIGYFMNGGFIHIDDGRKRQWTY